MGVVQFFDVLCQILVVCSDSVLMLVENSAISIGTLPQCAQLVALFATTPKYPKMVMQRRDPQSWGTKTYEATHLLSLPRSGARPTETINSWWTRNGTWLSQNLETGSCLSSS